MKGMKVEAEHYTLIAGLWFMMMGYFWFDLFVWGAIVCVLSYTIDLTKRMGCEIDCIDCKHCPELLKKMAD